MLISEKRRKGFGALDALANAEGYHRSSAPLNQWVALLSMKYRRAPLPVSRGLQKALKALMRRRVVADPAELGDLARRYLLLGDAQLLLAESRKRPILMSGSFEFAGQPSAERQTQSQTGVR